MSITVAITDGPLPRSSSPWLVERVGAILCFEGIVRPSEDDRPIRALDYQVYDPMATRQLEQLSRQIVDDFSLIAVAVEHSRGRVPHGQCSFRLRIASVHRSEGLKAMERFIDQMKKDVPIWKQPVFE